MSLVTLARVPAATLRSQQPWCVPPRGSRRPLDPPRAPARASIARRDVATCGARQPPSRALCFACRLAAARGSFPALAETLTPLRLGTPRQGVNVVSIKEGDGKTFPKVRARSSASPLGRLFGLIRALGRRRRLAARPSDRGEAAPESRKEAPGAAGSVRRPRRLCQRRADLDGGGMFAACAAAPRGVTLAACMRRKRHAYPPLPLTTPILAEHSTGPAEQRRAPPRARSLWEGAVCAGCGQHPCAARAFSRVQGVEGWCEGAGCADRGASTRRAASRGA